MKKYSSLILIIIFVLSGALVYYLIHNKSQNSNSTSPDRDFAVKDIDEVYKVFLGKKNGENIILERNGSDWKINNKYKAFPNTVHYFLSTLQNLKLKSIPPKLTYDLIMREMASIGIKVEIYNKENTILKTYYVGGVTEDETGLYCLMNGSAQPYVMHLNQAPTNLRVIYDINEVDWRDRNLFNIHAQDIEGLSIKYPYDPQRNLSISMENKTYVVRDNNNNSIDLPSNIDRKIKSYFNEFENCNVEAFVNDHRAKDSICSLTPYSIISIKTKNKSDSSSIKLYPIPEQSMDVVALDSSFLRKKEFFRLYACRNDGDMLLLQIQQISNIFYDLPQFIKALENKKDIQ
ncbi:MAG: DUF4340 domain-containing protein [Saprospiraceae bacterium]